MIRPRTISILGFLFLLGLTPALASGGDATSDGSSSSKSEAYREGQRALDDEEWAEASRLFGKIASSSSPEADAALYWKAYADWKRKLKKESLEGLGRLHSSYPKSPWVDDAKALELEIRDGKSVRSDVEDEELKLYALDGLMQVDAEQAIPVLEKLLAGDSSRRIKERALFVLSQSSSPRAREILVRAARSGEPMALRTEAIRTLGISGDAEDVEILASIARDASAPYEIKSAAIEAFLIAGRPGNLIAIAKSDPDPRVRSRAIDSLGAMGALSDLRQLWATESDPSIRAKLLDAFGVAGDADTLAKVARETADPKLRRKAIDGLGVAGTERAGGVLRKLYDEFSAPEDKRRVVEALMVQGDARVLVEMFRAEKDPALKKVILQQLSVMGDPEATQVILDILGAKP